MVGDSEPMEWLANAQLTYLRSIVIKVSLYVSVCRLPYSRQHKPQLITKKYFSCLEITTEKMGFSWIS